MIQRLGFALDTDMVTARQGGLGLEASVRTHAGWLVILNARDISQSSDIYLL